LPLDPSFHGGDLWGRKVLQRKSTYGRGENNGLGLGKSVSSSLYVLGGWTDWARCMAMAQDGPTHLMIYVFLFKDKNFFIYIGRVYSVASYKNKLFCSHFYL
jgi:hypothetical protein